MHGAPQLQSVTSLECQEYQWPRVSKQHRAACGAAIYRKATLRGVLDTADNHAVAIV